jgi:hypothetical protein
MVRNNRQQRKSEDQSDSSITDLGEAMISQNIRNKLLSRTARRIDTQCLLPPSPGYVSDNGAVFCTGAAFLYEAAQHLTPESDLGGFSRDLLAGGKTGLLDKAAELDLDVQMVEELISMNDSFSEFERKEKMGGFISKLVAEGREIR